MPVRHTHLCMHFHCDPIFTCPQAVHIAESIELAAQYVRLHRDDPATRCILSEIDYLQGYWNIFVEDRDEFLRLLRAGDIETSGSYSEPNENSVGGEALVRNIVYGQWFHVGYLGARGDVYMPFDVFGHVRQLPQLLRRTGFIGAVWTKGSPKGTRRSEEATWWVAPDGSRILNRVASYGSVEWGGRDQLDGVLRMARAAHKRRVKHQPRANIVFRGSDFISPSWWVVNRDRELGRGRVATSVPSAYFRDVLREVDEEGLNLPVTAREMSLYHAGTALSRSELKIASRLGENAVVEAETWATIATLFGQPYPEVQLDHAWRQLLFCQHHDSITGTSNDQSYLDLLSHLRESLAESAEARVGAIAALAARVATDAREGDPFVVFNSLSIPQTAVVEVLFPESGTRGAWEVTDETGARSKVERVQSPNGTSLRFLASDVPGIGHRTYWLTPGEPLESDVLESDDRQITIDTPHVRATFDPWRGGGIVSLVEKTTGRELRSTESDHPLNDLVRLKEGAGPEPSWEFHTTGEKWFSSTYRATVRAERTPTGWLVTARHPFPDTEEVVRTAFLSDASPRIDCTVTLGGYSGSRLIGLDGQARPSRGDTGETDNQPEDRDLFGVLFPVGAKGLAPVWSDRFSARVIRKSQNWLDFRTHQSNMYSGCAMYSAENWIAASPSTCVAVSGSSPTPCGFPFGMVRVVFPDRDTVRIAAERLIAALCARGVTATPFLDDEDGSADPLQTDQVIAVGGGKHNRWVASLQGFDDDHSRFVRDVELRFENPTPMNPNRTVPVLVIQGQDDVAVAAEVEKVIGELLTDRVVVPPDAVQSASIGPLDGAGLAILNRGTIAASCEPDGSLFMALQHSAAWCDWATPRYLGCPFVPERKTSIYHYALYPFAGSWAQARVPEVAAAYNRPPVALAAGRHGGDLPPRHGYVMVEGGGALISALKPLGQPSAQYATKTQDAANGVILRLWNWDREGGVVSVRWWSGLRRAWRTDLAERTGDPIPVDDGEASLLLDPNAVETIAMVPMRPTTGGVPPANVPPRIDRVDCRWWRHNTGAAPPGNVPIAVAIRGDLIPGETGTVRLSVANNWTDRTVVGEVRLTHPDGWAVQPAVLPIRLQALEAVALPVTVTVPNNTPGRLQAALSVDGITYADTIAFGETKEPDVRVGSTEEAITVTIGNPSEDALHLTATLITPLETWPEAVGYARYPVAFRERQLVLSPGASESFSIPVPQAMLRDAWAFVKVAGAGTCQYHRVPAHLRAAAELPAGTPFTLSVPRAEVALLGEANEAITLTISAAHRSAPAEGCSPSPLLGEAHYWTIHAAGGTTALTSARLRFAVDLAETGARGPATPLRMAVWRDDRWQEVPTESDERTSCLTVEVPPGLLASDTHWTVTGPQHSAWRTRVGGRFFEAEPVAADIDGDGRPEIVIGTARNQVCVLLCDGTIRWRRQFGGWIWPSPEFTIADVTGDGTVQIVVAPSDRTLWLLDRNGHVVWKREDLPFAGKPAPAVADIDGDGAAEVIVSVHDAGVWAYRRDGTHLWTAKLPPIRLSRPAIAEIGGDARILVSLGGKQLLTLDRRGKVASRLRFADGAAVERLVPAPVVTDSLHVGRTEIVFAGHDGFLRLLSTDGAVLWERDLGSPIAGTPVVVPPEAGDGSLIICAATRGTIFGIDGEGQVRWQRDLGASLQSTPRLVDLDGDGRSEITIGAGRTGRTYIFARTGVELGAIQCAGIWRSSAAAIPSGCGGNLLLVTGGIDECVVAARPQLVGTD